MPIPERALDLENRSIGTHGEPTLSAAYQILKEQWRKGDRDRDLGLHLVFLSWYGLIEPAHLTGFSESGELRSELNRTLTEVHEYFEPQIHEDAEMLYVFGLAAHLFWFMFDDFSTWEKLGIEYRARYRALAPGGLDPAIFNNRGAFGDYYAGQAAVSDGY